MGRRFSRAFHRALAWPRAGRHKIGSRDLPHRYAGHFRQHSPRAVPKGNAEDSFDVLRAFTEKQPGAPVRESVILQSAAAVYDVRMGDWKLVERANAPKIESVRNKRKTAQAARQRKAASKKDELYNLRDDPAETTNIAVANKDQAAKMKKFLDEARERGFTRPGAG